MRPTARWPASANQTFPSAPAAIRLTLARPHPAQDEPGEMGSGSGYSITPPEVNTGCRVAGGDADGDTAARISGETWRRPGNYAAFYTERETDGSRSRPNRPRQPQGAGRHPHRRRPVVHRSRHREHAELHGPLPALGVPAVEGR